MLFQAGTQGMAFWAPTVVKGMSDTFSNSPVGVILMVRVHFHLQHPARIPE